MVFKAAAHYDSKRPRGAEANTASYLDAQAAFEACKTAVLAHGGRGYAEEYHVERLLRESLIPRSASVSRAMILNCIGKPVLGLPKSY